MQPRCEACHLEVKNETAAVLLEHPWLQHGLVGLLGLNMHGVQAAEAPDLGISPHPWNVHMSQTLGLQAQVQKVQILDWNLTFLPVARAKLPGYLIRLRHRSTAESP